MIDLIKEIWLTMCTNKLRTGLTGLSVAWGIFMLILLLAISNGVIRSFEDHALNDDPYQINVYGGHTTMPYRGLKEGRDITLRERDFGEIARSDSKVTSVTGVATLNATISTSKDYVTTTCEGIVPDARYRNTVTLTQGRFINQADIDGCRKVIVLPRNTAETLFNDPDDAVGRVVKVADMAFTVVGVYDHRWFTDHLIPYTTARALKGFDDTVNEINVGLDRSIATADEADAVERSITEALSRAEVFDPADDNAVWTHNRFTQFVNSLMGLRILNIAMWVIGILTLITGIVGVSNIMFVSVRERTHEIGIRRAIGAKPRSILRQVVLESVAMTTVFGYIGIVMGTVATEIVKKLTEGSEFIMAPTVDMGIAIEVTIALIVAGALAGIFPALRALKIRPVEALSEE